MEAANDSQAIPIQAVIFGGGAAGLWTLDELTRRGITALLLEAGDLGQGQTVASQGILHGGLKYTLSGLLAKSAVHLQEMPGIWRDCLVGKRPPEIIGTPVRAEFCYLWRTEGVASRLGMIGARFGLRIAPQSLDDDERPTVLSGCPGTVAILEEQVISPAGLIANLAARNRERILQIDAESGVSFHCPSPGCVETVVLRDAGSGRRVALAPEQVILTAGAGNARLREQVGLSAEAMQRRPLQMVLLRGDLPTLNGHCVDGKRTRVTITSDVDSQGRTVWQVGGQVAEDGVRMTSRDLIDHTRSELEHVIPGIPLRDVEFTTYRVDRAEGATRSRRRPDTLQIRSEGNVHTGWPTKLVLVPRLAEDLARALETGRQNPADFDAKGASQSELAAAINGWPKPAVARPPWETAAEWRDGDSTARPLARAA